MTTNLKVASTFLLAGVLVACVPRGPVVDTTSPNEGVGGTIAGTVRAPLSARKVTAVNVPRRGLRRVVRDERRLHGEGAGRDVPAGVELRAGETLETKPGSTEINAGDLDAGRDFVITFAARR